MLSAIHFIAEASDPLQNFIAMESCDFKFNGPGQSVEVCDARGYILVILDNKQPLKWNFEQSVQVRFVVESNKTQQEALVLPNSTLCNDNSVLGEFEELEKKIGPGLGHRFSSVDHTSNDTDSLVTSKESDLPDLGKLLDIARQRRNQIQNKTKNRLKGEVKGSVLETPQDVHERNESQRLEVKVQAESCESENEINDDLEQSDSEALGKKIECKYCRKIFPSILDRIAHRRNPETACRCSACKELMPSQADLVIHQYKAHGVEFLVKEHGEDIQYPDLSEWSDVDQREKLRCPLCVKILTKRNIAEHVCAYHFEELSYKCCVCGVLLNTSKMWNYHCKFHAIEGAKEEKKVITSHKKRPRTSVLKLPNANDNSKQSTSLNDVHDKNFPRKTKRLKVIADETISNPDKHESVSSKTLGAKSHSKVFHSNGNAKELPQQPVKNALQGTLSEEETSVKPALESEKLFQCEYCQKSFTTLAQIRNHKKTQSLNVSCPTCGIHFASKAQLFIHQLEEHKNEATVLDGLYLIDWNPSLSFSKLSKGRDEITACPLCQKKVTLKCLVHHIMRFHTQECPLSCCVCGHPCFSRREFDDHCSIHIGIQRKGWFRCLECNEYFGSRGDLTAHQHIHRTTCRFCGEKFSFKDLLQKHYETCHKDKMFKCTRCDKYLVSKLSLKNHLSFHRNSKKYPCPKCGDFVTKLKQHMERRHTEQPVAKPYACTLCPKKFKMPNLLRLHMCFHTGERKYPCHICSKTFAASQYLRKHMKTHSQIKPHACHICGKRCLMKYNLTIHMRTHSQQKLFECGLCGQGFNYKASLQGHMRSKHKMEPSSVTEESQA